jgi:hypothetical protein
MRFKYSCTKYMYEEMENYLGRPMARGERIT